MKLLIDTNVVLDVILKREPFFVRSFEVLALSKKEDIQEYISASAVTDIYYLAQRQLKNKDLAKSILKELFTVVSVVGVSEQEIQNALILEWDDFEDAVQYSAARFSQINGIITRNPDDFRKSEIPVWEPGQALERIK